MKQATRDRLNALNLHFYAARAQEFSATRDRPWPGFARALELAAAALDEAGVPEGGALRVLDVGCGNGRSIAALRERFGDGFEYTGVDASAGLLAIASARHRGAGVSFELADFIASAPDTVLPAGPFDLVAVLGVLHHVPGAEARRALVRAAAARLAPSGMLAFTLWRFDQSARLQRRRLSARERAQRLLELAIDERELEPGDELLHWGDGDAVRYCHFGDDAECALLQDAADLAPLARYRADGEGGRLNDYVLLRARPV